MQRRILSYDESWYTGDYEYVYDPEHKNRPRGQGWYLTEKGWARGRNQEQGHVPSRVIHNPSVMKPTPGFLKIIGQIANTRQNVEAFVTSKITDGFIISKEVTSKFGNHRNNFRKIDDLIVGFADKQKPQVAHQLSTLMGYMFGLSPDFRNNGKPHLRYNEEILNQIKKYASREQEILRMTGLVNDDDTITLFRNTDEKQLPSLEHRLGKSETYLGNNFESWSTNPDLKFSPDGTVKIKVMVKVPLSACIATCIGRKERPFMFKDSNECEIMVCGAFIREVTCVGDSEKGINSKARNSYLTKIQSNMQRFSRQNEKKQASLSQRQKLAREILEIAKNILNE